MNALSLRNLETVVIEINEAASREKTSAVAVCKACVSVSNAIENQTAVDALRTIQRLLGDCEKSRVIVKGPVLQIGKDIDAKARDYCAELESEKARLNRLTSDFQRAEVLRREEEEKKRRAEADRLERERKAAEEAERKAAQEIEIQKAVARESLIKISSVEETPVVMTAPLQSHGAATAAQIVAFQKSTEETAKAESDFQLASQAVQAEQLRLSEARQELRLKDVALAATNSRMVAPAPKAIGQSVKTVWVYEVLDVHALAKHNMALVRVEPNASAIAKMIELGVRDIPGLRIYSEIKTQVRY